MATHIFLTERATFAGETGAGLMRNRCAFTSRDMGADWPEAFTYAVVMGWDGDPDEPGDEGAWSEMAERYGWDEDLLTFLRDAHRWFKRIPDRLAALPADDSTPTEGAT